MDNDKKIIKSPYYTSEDLKKYSELLQHELKKYGGEHISGIKGDQFISPVNGKKYTIGVATIKEIETHTDIQYRKINKAQIDELSSKISELAKKIDKKLDNENILEEKAILFALYMLQQIRSDTEHFFNLDLKDVLTNSKAEDNFISLGELFIEVASIYLLFIDASTFSLLGNKKTYEFFYDTFLDNFTAFALITNYGEDDAYAVQGAFISDLNKCLGKYAKFPLFGNKEGNETSKGTRVYEFVENLFIILRKEKNIFVITILHNFVVTKFTRIIDMLKNGFKINF